MKTSFKFNKKINKEIGNYNIPEKIKGGNCLDLGSCIGNFCVNNKDRFKNFFCFEANYENFLNLINNCTKNEVNFYAFNYALNNSSGKIKNLYIKEKQSTNQTCTTKDFIKDGWIRSNIGVSGKMNTFTINFKDTLNLLNIDNINYVKCDIEGDEYEYFMGQDLSMINCIGFELHYFMGTGNTHKNRKLFVKFLKKYFVLLNNENDVDYNSNKNFEWTFVKRRFL